MTADESTAFDTSSVVGGQAGIPLRLVLTATDAAGALLPGVRVDYWSCNALGAYSDVSGNGQANTVGQHYLRGWHTTNATGACDPPHDVPVGRLPHLGP